MPFTRTLQPGGTDTFNVSTPPGSQVVIQSSAVTTSFGPRKMLLTGPGGFSIASVTGIIGPFTGQADVLSLQISQLIGTTGGEYTVELNVVSGDAANCGRALQCGATPDGTGLAVPGEVDSFQTPPLTVGEMVTFKVNYLQSSGGPRLRLYAPDGSQVLDSCATTIQVAPSQSGIYTALVFAGCGTSDTGYRIEFYDRNCPGGPTITEFALARGTGEPKQPVGVDSDGRPIFANPLGQGFLMYVEARLGIGAGRNARLGEHTVPYQQSGVQQDGDLQVILSRDLGDGDPTVCDIAPPDLGGVPATVPLVFQTTDAAVADMGCRFNNGKGDHLGVTDPLDACTKTGQLFGYSFVDQDSSTQYCAQIDTAWAFPPGDTIVAARLKDTLGNFGVTREIVVRIGDANPTSTPTPTPSPPPHTVTRTATATPIRTPTPPHTQRPTATDTRTRTPTRTGTVTPTGPTATPTMTPSGGVPTPCVGDCDHTDSVSIGDITRMVSIALGNMPLSICAAGDANGDGVIDIGDLVIGVTNALNGCPSGGS